MYVRICAYLRKNLKDDYVRTSMCIARSAYAEF